MVRGRKPLPQEKLELRGTARPDRLRPSSTLGAPIPLTDIRKCQVPGLKSANARTTRIYWNVIRELAVNKMLEKDFCVQVLIYATYLDTFISCSEDIEERGLICTGINKEGAPYSYPNPSVKMRDNATEKLLKIGSNFGFSPVDRQRLKLADADDKGSKFKGMVAFLMTDEDGESPEEQ